MQQESVGLAGKKVIMNGRAHGLVLAALRHFAREGADVAFLSRDPAKVDAAVKEVDGCGPGTAIDCTGDAECYKDVVPALYEGTLATMPMGCFGEPEGVAKAIVFVASPACPYLTGANVVIDGGFTQRVQF